jgi:hypothetical protein
MIPYIEDVYPLFHSIVNKFDPTVATAARQFKTMCLDGKQFTNKQATYLLVIMATHRHLVTIDLSIVLDKPHWKQPFRQIDTGKRVWVDDTTVNIQFPFSIKSYFEEAFDDTVTAWDYDNRVRTGSLYDINITQLYDFAVRHGFEIDALFESFAYDAETYIHSAEDPHSAVIGGSVYLVNASTETEAWFDTHKTGQTNGDLFLAKHMGYRYTGEPQNLVECISVAPEHAFWMDDFANFLLLCHDISGNICIVLDRASDNYKWLCRFLDAVGNSPIELNQVKYGSALKGNSELSDLVVANGLNQNIKHGKITIFTYQPTKWLLSGAEDVMLLVTNNLYPTTNTVTRDWLESHPCVIHLSEYCPTIQPRSTGLVKL